MAIKGRTGVGFFVIFA